MKRDGPSDQLQYAPPKARPKQQWLGAALALRRKWRKGMFIDYPDVRAVLLDVLEKIEYCITAESSIAMHVIAESGAGKSTLIDEVVRVATAAHWREDPEKTVKPALVLEAPSPCTPAELCYSILEALGDPFGRRRAKQEQTGSLTAMTAELLIACEVRVILFDNFQDIPSARRARGIEQVGLRLRDLIDETKCCWVFVGTDASREVISAKSQLLKRVPYQTTIRDFDITSEGAPQFLRLLQRIDAWLPLAESSCDVLKKLSGHIYVATEGIMDAIVKLLDHSWESAFNARREQLCRTDLRDGFRRVFGRDRPNPFDEDFILRRLNGPNEPYEKFGTRAGRRSTPAQARGA